MHKGYVVELGPAEEIYTHPLHPYTRSLLTAIPQPDPKTKDQRKKIPYVQGNIVYGQCKWKDYGNEHFVLVNEEIDADICERIKKIKAAK
jgi:oligopeptide transport system ATP-binding protein